MTFSGRTTFLGTGFLLCLITGFPTRLYSQAYTATLEGVVTDSSSAVMPGTKVEITNVATNVKQTKQTNDRGIYYFPFLPPGPYRLRVEARGFKAFERTDIILQVQQSVKINIELSPGEINTMMEVTGEAPRLDNVNATLGRVVENISIDKLPNAGRDPLALAQLSPAIVPVGGYKMGGGVNFSANGGRLNITDVLLDGVTLNQQEHNGGIQYLDFMPTTETVQEFKVQTNSFSAEYGMSGNAVISMVSKSGTNDLHGDAFYIHNRNSLRANNFFSNAAGLQLCPPERRVCVISHRLGAAGGGPVYIPKVYNGRDKTFFYFHYERDQNPASAASEIDHVPTVLEKNGDFSQTFKSDGSPITIFDPTTVRQNTSGAWMRDPFAGNIVPKSRWNSVASTVMPFYPDPKSEGRTPAHLDNYTWQGTSTNSWYQLNAKIDHYFTDKQRISGRYSRQYSANQGNENPWGNCPSGYSGNQVWCNATGNFMLPEGYSIGFSMNQSAFLDYTYTINPTTILSVRGGVTRHNSPSDRVGAQGSFDEKALGFSGTALQIQMPPRLWMEDYTSIGESPWFGAVNAGDMTHFMASLTRVQGVHTLKAGGEGRFQRLNYAQPPYNTADFDFCRRETAQQPLNPGTNDGSALASFMLGFGGSCVTGRNQQGFVIVPMNSARSYSWYVSDEYRVTSKVTLSFGLRYELNLPVTERHNRQSWIDLSLVNPIAAEVAAHPLAQAFPNLTNLRGGYAYASSSQRYPWDVDKNDLAPRFGFAYQFARNMVVRGGYGIFYGLSSAQANVDPPSVYASSTNAIWSLDGGVHQNASITNPFPNGINVPIGYQMATNPALGQFVDLGGVLYAPVRSVNVTPQIQQWSVSIQRELPANSVFEMAYSGSKGTHLGFGTGRDLLNMFPTSALSLGDQLYDQLPNPFYGLVSASQNLGGSATISRAQLLKPYPQFYRVYMRPGPPQGNSIYHALQLTFSKRLTHGLQITSHYTWSKLISDSDSADDPNLDWLAGSIAANGDGRPTIQNWGDLRQERSVSILNIPHRFVADFSYQLPFGRGQLVGRSMNRVVDAFVGGWQINGLMTLAAGPPLIPHYASTNLGGAIRVQQRPNLLSDPSTSGPIQSRLNGYLNAAAFSAPAPYTFGSAPRVLNQRGPGFRGIDASMFKQFFLSENRSRYIELRVEVFNATNTPVFGVPGTTLGASNFGVISSQVNSPRVVQLQGKIYF